VRKLAERPLNGGSGLMPVLVKLRDWEKNHSVVEMVSQTVVPHGVGFELRRFQRMFDSGRLVLLIDGYDEFAIRVGYERAADQLSTFLQAMQERSKVLLTSRPSHFHTREQAVSAVFHDVLSHTRHHVYQLLPFEQDEQRRFLTKWFQIAGERDPPTHASRWMTALAAVDRLPELAQTPRMLSFMVSELRIEEIEQTGRGGGAMTAALLYERLIDEWLLATILSEPGEWKRLGDAELSEMTACFLRDIAPEQATRWIRSQGEQEQADG
jgi:NACHT domain